MNRELRKATAGLANLRRIGKPSDIYDPQLKYKISASTDTLVYQLETFGMLTLAGCDGAG